MNAYIRNQFYVEDGSGGADDEEEALKLKEELKSALALGGFTLAKWKSNCARLLEGEETLVKSTIGTSQEDTTKVLGVGWDAAADEFTFVFDQKTTDKQVKTPRELVSVQASLFDPSATSCLLFSSAEGCYKN